MVVGLGHVMRKEPYELNTRQGNILLTTIISGISLLGASGYLVFRNASEKEQKRQEHYSSIPQSEVISTYDLDRNRSLDQDELGLLMQDYHLERNSTQNP